MEIDCRENERSELSLIDCPPDIVREVGLCLTRSQDWKSLNLVCCYLHTSLNPIASRRRRELENHLWKLIELFPNKPWEWYLVSQNPNTTWDHIVRHSLKDYPHVYSNPNITPEIIDSNPDCLPPLSISRRFYSSNPNLTWETIISRDPEDWDWFEISQLPCITWDIVEKNTHYPKTSPFAGKKIPWKFGGLCRNPNITWETIASHPKLSYHRDFFSGNPNLTWETVKDNPDVEWWWNEISANPCITLDIVVRQNLIEWNFGTFSRNPNVTWDLIQSRPFITGGVDFDRENGRPDHDGPILWRSFEFSRNPNVTWETVRDNPQFKWDWYQLSRNRFGK